jgi:hypothetical protein
MKKLPVITHDSTRAKHAEKHDKKKNQLSGTCNKFKKSLRSDISEPFFIATSLLPHGNVKLL